jgi:arylsulfatase A-like enzyme
MSNQRILIVAFDALRPDMATPDLMPNLNRFADTGVRFLNARSTFPTETRVNQTSLVTGAMPARHGIVGNHFMDRVASPDKLFNTGDEDALREGDKRLGGQLVDAPVLGEALAATGESLAVVSAGTPGGTRMLHHRAEQLGQFRMSLHRPDASTPQDQIKAAIDRVGPIPKHAIPSLDWLGYTVDLYLDYIQPELDPTVTILWFCEPDNSYHFKGLGSDDNHAALARADAEFGRILAWRETAGLGESLQIITLSDHGQLTVTADAVDVAGALRDAGFSVGETPFDGADCALSLSSAGGVYVRDSDPELIRRIVEFLQRQPWCGVTFTRDGDLSHKHFNIDHPRAPDIGLVMASDDAPNEAGIAGSSLQDYNYPVGGGLHGGVHQKELHTWLAMNGGAFKDGVRADVPAGIVDIFPTVLSLLNIDPPAPVDGRVLSEALQNGGAAPTFEAETHAQSGVDGYSAHLSAHRVGATRYLNRGWVERR